MIKRGEKFITPNGATKLEQDDRLFVLSETRETLSKVFNCLELTDQASLSQPSAP